MTETTRRFLRAIAERIPESRIVELRLFRAMRQAGGAIESGVAVIAVIPGVPQVAHPEVNASAVGETEAAGDVEPDASPPVSASDTASPVQAAGSSGDEETDHSSIGLAGFPTDGVRAASDQEVPLPIQRAGDDGLLRYSDREVSVPHPLAAADAPLGASSPSDDEPEESIALGDILALPSPSPELVEPRADDVPPIIRYAILSAHYRLTLKGPERGKWEVDIVHEADAPLDTLARVARGVARRAGDDADPEHVSADELHHALNEPAWVTAT